MGRELHIYTDNKANTFLKRRNLLPPRVTRWFLFLEQFNFTLEHVAGKDNPVADALSRFNKSVLEKKADYSSHHFEYKTDNRLNSLFRQFSAKQCEDGFLSYQLRNKNPRFQLRNELYRFKGYDGKHRIYVPNDIQLPLIKHYHLYYGHIGIGLDRS